MVFEIIAWTKTLAFSSHTLLFQYKPDFSISTLFYIMRTPDLGIPNSLVGMGTESSDKTNYFVEMRTPDFDEHIVKHALRCHLLKEVQFIWNFLWQTRSMWPFNTCDCLIKVTALAGLTVITWVYHNTIIIYKSIINYLGGTRTPNFGDGTGFDTGIIGGKLLLGGGLILLKVTRNEDINW